MSDINRICDALFGSIVVTEQGVERKQPPNLDEFSLSQITQWFQNTSCTVPMIKILEYLAEFKYNDHYKSPFGGEPSYFADDFRNSKVINQAIDYVYDRVKY